MNSLQQQFSLDKKIVNVIHLLSTISVENIMLYFSVSEKKAIELLDAFIHRIEDGHIKHIRGNLSLFDAPIKSLGGLQTVGGDLDLYCSDITSLGHLQTVGRGLYVIGTKIASLGHLQSVGDDLILPKSNQIPQAELDRIQVGGEISYF